MKLFLYLLDNPLVNIINLITKKICLSIIILERVIGFKDSMENQKPKCKILNFDLTKSLPP